MHKSISIIPFIIAGNLLLTGCTADIQTTRPEATTKKVTATELDTVTFHQGQIFNLPRLLIFTDRTSKRITDRITLQFVQKNKTHSSTLSYDGAQVSFINGNSKKEALLCQDFILNEEKGIAVFQLKGCGDESLIDILPVSPHMLANAKRELGWDTGNNTATYVYSSQVWQITKQTTYQQAVSIFGFEGTLIEETGTKGNDGYAAIYKWAGEQPDAFVRITFINNVVRNIETHNLTE
ncbi:hypothetical protein MUG87_02810 [Ectobacillus sp. JY-23]|uniref:hypothetical protein n=1 Tax=Ectobacillus sp. JY-23 TaxID=2933872 RepID=UPI001FF19995|nr:hypothetical protein [Ectobacillus sp. JY-23]UOY93084.1 hypothetical protein MUG87_02810 [Ectobacillus sp. JY-23]